MLNWPTKRNYKHYTLFLDNQHQNHVRPRLYTLSGQCSSMYLAFGGPCSYLCSPATNIEKIRDDLYSSFKVKARCYVPTGPSSRFNHTWFEDLRNELAIIPVPVCPHQFSCVSMLQEHLKEFADHALGIRSGPGRSIGAVTFDN